MLRVSALASALCFCFVRLHFVLLTCVVCLAACACSVCLLAMFAALLVLLCIFDLVFLLLYVFALYLRFVLSLCVFALGFCFGLLHFVLLTCVVCLQTMQVPGLPAYNSIILNAPVPEPSTPTRQA